MDTAGSARDTPSLVGRFIAWQWSSAVLTGLAFLACIAAWLLTDAEAMRRLMHEEGPVESATAVGYGIAAIALLLQARHDPRLFLSSAFVVTLLLMRELDLDHAFTSESVLAIRFYSFASVPLTQKLIVAPIVLALVIFVLDYLRRYGRPALRGLAARRPEAWTIANVVLLLAYSVSIDGLHRKIRGILGIEPPALLSTHVLSALEEGMELVIPILILWALLQTVLHRPARTRVIARQVPVQ